MENYAGFWIRVGAYLIDFLIMLIPLVIIEFLLGDGMATFNGTSTSFWTTADTLTTILGIAYFVYFESSPMQATPGKKALGLIVTDTSGNRITPLRALGRYLGKILSSIILLIGFIMVAFTERKQGLHDMLASTLVLKGVPGQVPQASVFE